MAELTLRIQYTTDGVYLVDQQGFHDVMGKDSGNFRKYLLAEISDRVNWFLTTTEESFRHERNRNSPS